MAIYTAPARLNAIRVNAFRLGAGAYEMTVFINGTQVTKKVRRLETEIRETASEAPNTCSAVVRGTQPAEGQQITIRLGGVVIFDGQIAAVAQLQSRSADRKRWRVEGIDWTRLLDRRLVFKSYVNQTPNAIISDVLATFTSGFTTANVQAGLTWLNSASSATWTFAGKPPSVVLHDIAAAVGGTFKLRYDKGVYLRTTSTLASPTAIDTTTRPSNLQYRRLMYDRKLDQIRTRVYVKGGRTRLTSPVAVGAVTLGVDDTSMFASSGGSALLDDWQVLAYTGIGVSSALPTPSAPSAALAYFDGVNAVSVNNGSDNGAGTVTVTTNAPHGLLAGQVFIIFGNTSVSVNGVWTVAGVTDSTHFTFSRGVDTANTGNNGYLRPCFAASQILTRGTVATLTTTVAHGLSTGQVVQILNCPSTALAYLGWWTITSVPTSTTFTFSISGHPADSTTAFGQAGVAALLAATSGTLTGGAYKYKASFAGGSAETLASPATSTVTPSQVADLDSTIPGCSPTGGGSLQQSSTYRYGFSATTDTGETAVTNLQSPATGGGQTAFSIAVPLSYMNDPRVRAVNIWRSIANAASSIANLRYAGTATPGTNQLDGLTWTFLDTLADANLGSPPPTTNTTGGAIAVSSIATSSDNRAAGRNVYRTASGGSTYLRIGSISDGTTTGFVDGAADTALGSVEPSAATPFPGSLTGVTGITAVAGAGAPLALWVQRDDATAQTALAALEGGDGVHELPIDDPNLLTISAANARGDAELALGKNVEEQVSYTTQDAATQVGATVSVNIGGIVTTQKIQSQRIYWVKNRRWAQRDIVATNQFKDLYQYLRDLQGAA